MSQWAPKRPVPGNPTTAEWANSIVSAFRRGIIQVSGGLTIRNSSSGVNISAAGIKGADWGMAKTPSGGIPARDGTTGEITYATCTLYIVTAEDVTLGSTEIEVGNPLAVAIGGEKDIYYQKHPISGRYLVQNEVCG